ncbi:CHAT domain-containing protein [Nodosilinea nodulosa]|uniref:CHAT domain-containing protein n=1 Tax=Nodosilinea nodulosa TaxID=416001 RepID=UPI001CEDE2DB|nr:CHAT domain-containing protein [Nodosilinea nodulosa]
MDVEVRRIEEAFLRSHHRDRFQIVTKLATRPADLRQALVEYRPQIVHFSGHGTETQGLVMENDQGKVQLVSTEALGRLFGAFDASPIECVLLNACYSEVQANAIHQYVDCVIGMNRPIGDQAAIQFSQGFYDALGAGSTYAEAFKMGCSAIDLEGGVEYLTPQLIGGKGGRAISPVGQGLPAPEPTATDGGTVRPAPSQSIGNVTISGSNNPFNAIQAGGNVKLNQSGTQSSSNNPDLEAALTLLAKLQQQVVAADALTSFAKKDTESKIAMLQEELLKPEPDKGFVKEVVEALKQGLAGVLTLAEPVTQVAGLVAKALRFML